MATRRPGTRYAAAGHRGASDQGGAGGRPAQSLAFGVIDLVDFASERNGERDVNPAKLVAVVETFSDPRYRLGLADVQPDFLGRAYEYLLRKFAEGSGQSAGEFSPPPRSGS